MEDIQQENIQELLGHIHQEKVEGEDQRGGKSRGPKPGLEWGVWEGQGMGRKGRTWKGPSRSRTQPWVGFAGLGVVLCSKKSLRSRIFP